MFFILEVAFNSSSANAKGFGKFSDSLVCVMISLLLKSNSFSVTSAILDDVLSNTAVACADAILLNHAAAKALAIHSSLLRNALDDVQGNKLLSLRPRPLLFRKIIVQCGGAHFKSDVHYRSLQQPSTWRGFLV